MGNHSGSVKQMKSPAVKPRDPVADALERHRERLLCYIERRLAPSLAARVAPEDILQEVWMRVRDKWEGGAGHEAEPRLTYLCAVARRCAADAWRRHTRKCRSVLLDKSYPSDTGLQSAWRLESPGDGPLSHLEESERQQQLLSAALEYLKEKDREILDLRIRQGKSVAEVAARLHISLGTAYARFSKALERLRAVLPLLPADEVAAR
jgi:RNA polymerase sigma factor (sigma-70 family)